MASQGSDGKGSGGTQRDDGGSGAAAKRKRTWTHNGIEFTSEPYEWKKKLFFAINTGGGMESICVEEGSHVWAHYEKEDYRMIAGEDNCWMKQLKPNQKNKNQQVSQQDIEDELSRRPWRRTSRMSSRRPRRRTPFRSRRRRRERANRK